MPNADPTRQSKRIRLAPLPFDDRAWRLDWFGTVGFEDRSKRGKHPLVRLHLSLAETSQMSGQGARGFQSLVRPPIPPQLTCSVSVGQLVLLRIGDIWREQRLASRPDHEIETFEDVQIDSGTTSVVKAGHSLPNGDFILPLEQLPGHQENTHSYCVLVELPNSRRIVIPCMELIRFYFGSSSSLITKLFMPPLERSALYDQADFDESRRLLKLNLAQGIKGSSAPDIGRLALSPQAWQAALNVGTSILQASAAREDSHPQMGFPFTGKTTLTASGRWLSCGGRPRETFLAHYLRTCSHPLPYKALRYVLKSEYAGNGVGQDQSQSPEKRSAAAPKPDEINLVEQDGSNTLAPVELPYRMEPRFTDLARKPVWKESEQVPASAEATYVGGSQLGPVGDVAVGLPGSNERIRPAELQGWEHLMSPFTDDLILELIDALKSELGTVEVYRLDLGVAESDQLRHFVSEKLNTEEYDLATQWPPGTPVKAVEIVCADSRIQAIFLPDEPDDCRLYLGLVVAIRGPAADGSPFAWVQDVVGARERLPATKSLAITNVSPLVQWDGDQPEALGVMVRVVRERGNVVNVVNAKDKN